MFTRVGDEVWFYENYTNLFGVCSNTYLLLSFEGYKYR